MIWKCAKCAKELETSKDRMPKAWKKRPDGDVWCAVCWKEGYVLRAVSIPVVCPLNRTWDEFGKKMRELWRESTRASNWISVQLYTRDNHSRETGKLQRMPPFNDLYMATRQAFPGLPSRTAAALGYVVQKKYVARRYELVWLAKISLPTYRYPTPFPVPNQGWTVELENGVPIVSLRLEDMKVRKDQIQVRLKGGHEFRRQLQAVKQIVAGEAVQGQLDLYQQGKSVMCKMVAWLPRTVRDKADGTLFVRTDQNALLVALNHKDERLWIYNGDQARRWSAEHRHMLQRLAEDQKAEHRPTPPFARRRAESAQKYRDRMTSLTHQLSAHLVSYAVRRKFQTIRYDDSDTTFCPKFPWFELRAKIAEKADAAGRTFEHAAASGAAEEKTAEPLVGE